MSPETLLDKLKKDSSSKSNETLDSIYRICVEQKERGISDFSIATIAKLGHNRGVPKAQSIRNKSGEKYRALIAAFASNSPRPIKPAKSDENWIDEIPNPKHKLLARIQSSELRAAKRELEEVFPPNLRVDVYDHQSTAKPTEESALTAQERRALEYVISNQFQTKWNLSTNVYGEMVDSENKPVFKVATIDAIKKALEHL